MYSPGQWLSWLEHHPSIKRLRVLSLVGVCMGGNRLMFLSLYLSVFPPLSLISKHNLRRGLKTIQKYVVRMSHQPPLVR